ncbi:hypothetical protein QVG61_03240 [Thiohalobacter sp. IOR34]|uniref:hypothetical protein n=1 Tax=Thiohalobacter sp. IOR34 TaxID=3057176 RepID=UPI0025B26E6E|nr:hypothetical protein [Thiohalobacter sp. IOR34]WJW76122.1 hypothetical protein QVG61_03240 [Thiohalobacter sp. IOR34]
MLEYAFFDTGLRERFVRFVRGRGIDCQLADDGREVLLVRIADDIDETHADEIDGCYDRLLGEQAGLFEDELEKSVAGIRIQLGDGRPCTVRFRPDLLSRALECLSLEEFQELLQAVVRAVENPDDGPICRGR